MFRVKTVTHHQEKYFKITLKNTFSCMKEKHVNKVIKGAIIDTE